MRLTQVDYGTAKTVEYSLDALGNRTNEVQTVRPAVGSSVVTSFNGTYNLFNQQLTRNRSGGGLPALSTSFAYDNNGNTLAETAGTAVTSYTWDRDNRLRSVTPPSPGVPTQYAYDANGLRVERIDATGTARYLLDGLGVLAELDGASTTSTRFLNGAGVDDIVSFERSAATYWPLTDALGSWYAVTDSSGALVRRFDFDVYGTRADLGGTGPTPDVGFTGQRHDANGLMGIGDRPYLSRTGTWLEPDRAGMIDGPNIYAYVKNAPTMFTDPTGKRVNVDKSDIDQLMLLNSAIATRIGFKLYLDLVFSPVEVRFLSPTDPRMVGYFADPRRAGLTGTRTNTAFEELELQQCGGEFVGVATRSSTSRQLGWSAEATLVHEMRHAVDLTQGKTKAVVGERAIEARGYAAGIVAEQQLTGEDDIYWNRAGKIVGPFTSNTYAEKVRVMTLDLLDEVQR